MSKLSRNKGKRGEREVAEVFRAAGISARRGVQFQGGPGSPDVVTGLPWLHVEVKRTEKYPATGLAQAEQDAGPDQVPIVAWRRNDRPWLAVMRLDVLAGLLKRLA